MSLKSRSLILVLFLFLNFLVSLSSPMLAQESVRINKANLSEGITLELDTEALTPSANFLAVEDTSNQILALTNLTVNDQNIWLKNSNEEVVNSNNAVHWYYDEEAQILFVNLTGIKANFFPSANLQFTIMPVNSSKTNLFVSVFEAVTDTGNSSDDLQRISDLNVDLK